THILLILSILAGCGGSAAPFALDPGVDAGAPADSGVHEPTPEAGDEEGDATPTAGAGVDAPSPDAGDAAPEADAAPFSPSQLPGLVLWLAADTGVTNAGGTVSAWGDGSGKANHAAQPTAANQPTFLPNGVHGHPALAFMPTSAPSFLRIADAASLNWGT